MIGPPKNSRKRSANSAAFLREPCLFWWPAPPRACYELLLRDMWTNLESATIACDITLPSGGRKPESQQREAKNGRKTAHEHSQSS